ncbi:MAG TPA: hypothetical protein VE269_03410 [Gaiellaceae bacterium]|nr:hypothetical protein [Gaiellaceae bacterium]
MKRRWLLLVVPAVFCVDPVAAVTSAGQQLQAGSHCRAGFRQVVVARRRLCRPAPDLRVNVAAAPEANRVGGVFTYDVVVRNVGRRRAPRVRVSADGPGDAVSATTSTGTCTAAQGALHASCDLGTVERGGKAMVTIVAGAAALGPLSLSVRAVSSVRDARPKDDATTITTSVTEPDAVKGVGVRAAFGGGQRPAVTNEVDAISGPTGADPTGTFRVVYPTFELRGRVVCLTVVGNRASVGGIVEQSNESQYPAGHAIQLAFTDNGDPGAGKDTQVTYPGIENASPCPVPLFADQPELPLTEGNYVVRDVQP